LSVFTHLFENTLEITAEKYDKMFCAVEPQTLNTEYSGHVDDWIAMQKSGTYLTAVF
jgi:hypothetical protein